MKKFLLTVIVSAILLLLCSCSYSYYNVSRNSISSIQIDDTVYETIYLYTFKNADLDGEFGCSVIKSSVKHDILHDSYGYSYSPQKLSPGDEIKVWRSCFRKSTNSGTYSSGSDGSTAIVDEIINTYRIEVKETKDTYIITYFEIPWWHDTASLKEDLYELQMNTIEVTKSRATIKYET